MRLTLILVVLTTLLTPLAQADPQGSKEITLPAISVAESLSTPTATTSANGFNGQPVNSRLKSTEGLRFDTDDDVDVYRPLIYGYIQSLGGVPTRDATQAPIIAEWSFARMSPRETYASGSFGNWGRRIGGRVENEKILVRATVSFFENTLLGEPGSNDHYRCGRLVAGPFVGTGKASATTSWEAFFSSCSWARGLNLRFGQEEEWGSDKLQFKALVESVRNLKPATPLFPAPPR